MVTGNEEEWRRVREIFEAVVDLDDDERRRRLEALGRSEPAVCREVEALLTFDEDQDPLTSVMGLAETERRAWVGAEDGETWKRELGDGGAGLDIGSRLGAYRLVELLGQGGSSFVYRAVRDDLEYDQDVAIKVLRGGRLSSFGIERVRRERQILASLDHAAIARLTDGGTVDGMPFLVMELVDGLPITDHCSTYELGIDERLSLFLEVLDGVQYAHRHLIIHRDLKPANILVRGDGRPKLLDFGIAKLMVPDELDHESEETRTGMLLMTPSYAAPEQVQGRAVTTVSDVYSLGVVLYRLLTDQRPYDADSQDLGDVIRVVCETEPPLPSKADTVWWRRLTGDLDHIVMKALAKSPQDRYESVAAFAEDIRRHRAGLPIEARAASFGYRFGKFIRRNRLALGAATLVSLSLLVGLLNGLRQYQITQAALDEAQTEARRAGAVNDFLIHLMTSVDPREGKGASVTLLEAIQRGEPRMGVFFSGEPRVEATVRRVLGASYRALGRIEDAERNLSKALILLPKDPDPVLEARVRSELAQTIEQAGDTEGAVEHLLKVVTAEDGTPDMSLGWPAVGAALQLAAIYGAEGDREKADFWFQTAWKRSGNVGPGDGATRARLIDTAAHFARRRGDYVEAIRLSKQAVDMLSLEIGPHAYHTSLAKLRLSSSAYQLGQYELAESNARDAAESLSGLLGEHHRLVARAYHTVGLAVSTSGRLDEALDWLHRSIAVQDRALPEGDPERAYFLSTLGRVQLEAGRLTEADESLRRARELVSGLPESHDSALQVMGVSAGVWERLGEKAKAEAAHRSVLSVRQADGNPLTLAYARRALGLFLFRADRAQEAREHLQEAFSALDGMVAVTDGARLTAGIALSRCLLQLGETKTGLILAARLAEEAGDELLGVAEFCQDFHSDVLTVLQSLGRAEELEAWRLRQSRCGREARPRDVRRGDERGVDRILGQNSTGL